MMQSEIVEGFERKEIGRGITYFTPTRQPLSSNVVLIESESALWLYDVGRHPEVPGKIREIAGGRPVKIILSHFHPDHIENLPHIDAAEIYQGKNTYRYTGRGQIVSEDCRLRDGEMGLHLFPFPSSHVKGALALEVNETYCFLGDALYPQKKENGTVYNVGILKEQIELLENIQAVYLFLSHREPFSQKKQWILRWLKELYGKREKNQAYIEVRENETII